MTDRASAGRWIYEFVDDPPSRGDPVDLLGGKGANLAEMSRVLGLPVPPGFIITTEACRAYMESGWPEDLDGELDSALERLGKQLGARLGDVDKPLLVSVRSGAPVSMPGMMDTLLNVGITPAIREGLARGSAAFAADTWLRFSTMYADLVLGVALTAPAEEAVREATDADSKLRAADRVHTAACEVGGIPESPREQIRGAVEAVFRSWNSPRARVFREQENLPDSLGTAVVIQAMVFGNLDDRSGTGVVFTRDPATGAPGPFGDYLARAQGEDVVAGTHAVNGLQHLSESMPEVFSELETALERLERHYRDMCDVEFTVSAGRLYILQVRIGRRSPLAAVRIAVSMAADDRFPLTKAEAVERIDSETLQQLALLGRVRGGAEPLAGGLPASPGVGVGVLCCDPDRAADLSAHGIAFVLAREETSPADIHGMVGAAALVTSLGGVASHAAVVARSWAIPAVTGLGNMDVLSTGIRVGQTFVAEGEQVTVDGGTGVIFKGNQLEGTVTDIREVGTLRAWATELGQEPGGAREEVDPGRTTDVTLLELARAVQLKGLCTPERAAAALAAGLERVNDLVEGNEQLFRDTPRGMMLTPEGRDWVLRRLEDEREAADVARLTEVYGDFMVLNHRFKRIVSEWQRGEGGGEGDDPGWEEVVSGISTIHSELQPLLGAVADEVPRLDGYVRRFVHALAAITAGDRAMLASPVKDSYHTVWFEFHEELINLCGKDRAAEEAAGG